MTSIQFNEIRTHMELSFSFKLHFDRSQAYADLIFKSQNTESIEKLIACAHEYNKALESIISNTLVSDEKNAGAESRDLE